MLGGKNLLAGSKKAVRQQRGRSISYVPQDPGQALNPSRRIGDAIEVMLKEHGRPTSGKAVEALGQVHLPADDVFARRFPHQISGGQQQRVAIAIAIVCEPPVVVLDEPTTGLDVVTQAHIIDEVGRLRRDRGIALVYVSHDLAVVAQVADQIAVMYAGRIVENGPAKTVLREPRHPYTRGLISAIPDPRTRRQLRGIPGISVGVGERPPGCSFSPRCELATPECDAAVPGLDTIAPEHGVRCIHWSQTPDIDFTTSEVVHPTLQGDPLLAVKGLCADHTGRLGTHRAVSDVSFEIYRGQCLALVGESGSGKTTIARCIAGLHAPSAGDLRFAGTPLVATAQKRDRDARRRIQLVFQNPYESLNPSHTVADEVARPARTLLGLSKEDANGRVGELLQRVRLPTRVAHRYPGELSGGERQRVAIARALAANPELMVCDEITSALDVSVQAAVLELLEELREQLGLSLLFITHDLGVVSSIADTVAVLHAGVVCETGPTRTVLDSPSHEYTQSLLAAAPSIESGVAREA